MKQNMSSGASKLLVVIVVGAIVTGGQALARDTTLVGDENWVAPRTAWGHPDLQGTWSTDDMRGVPLQRPPQYGERRYLTDEEFEERERLNHAQLEQLDQGGTIFLSERGVRTFRHTSLIVDPPDGRLPAVTPEAEERRAAAMARFSARPASFLDRSLFDRCITRGVVGSTLPSIYGNAIQILQTPDSVVIRYEMIHETRVIPVDGRPPLDSGIRTYMGDPRGHWDGDTLVVETTNFLGETSFGGGPPMTPETRLIERFTRVGQDRIDYQLVVEDPGTYTRPFTIELPITTQPDYELLPYECHEGNYALQNILRAARAEERAVAEALERGLPPPESAWRDGGGQAGWGTFPEFEGE